jgi:HAD superfamily hydrolase (TIGR01509 family)
MIRLVLFDWGGVLTAAEFDRQVGRDLAARSGLPEDELYRAWREGRRLAVERGEAALEESWEELAGRFGLHGAVEDFAGLLRGAIVPDAAAIDLLPPLRSRVSLGLLSNNYPVVSSLVRKSLGAYFDGLFFSNETGLVKPDPAAYREALETLGFQAGETLFVDDKERNLAPARALGMRGHRYEGAPALRAELVELGLLVA